MEENLECLEKLVQFGGPSLLASNGKSDKVQSLLHTAVHHCCTDIVSYLLRKWEEFGVDVNETAIYFPVGNDMEFTPLERAVRLRNIQAIKLLLKHPGIKMSGFKELHFCLEQGHTDIALLLLDHFSAEEVAADKIKDKWALHCLPPEVLYAFRLEFTKKLILEYVRRGWDVNSVSDSTICKEVTLLGMRREVMQVTNYTLLHLACLYGGLKVIKMLVEEAGADINLKTEGELEFTPVQILLTLKEWKGAAYLIDKGADLSVRGSFRDKYSFTKLMRNYQTLGRNSFNAVELLVRMGCEEGLPLMDQVLARDDVVWNGVNEFDMAVERANPVYISKVLQHCAKLISKQELSSVAFRKKGRGSPEEIPTLLHLLETLSRKDGRRGQLVNVPALAELINLMVSLGYDLNLSQEHMYSRTGRILQAILEIDFRQDSSNLLLRTVLQVDHFRLNSPLNFLNPLDFVLRLLSRRCDVSSALCWEDKPLPPSNLEAAKLFVCHGVDVTGMVIDSNFKYHFGYNVILKMLYCAGAQISEYYFYAPPVCHPGHPETQPFLQEIAEVKQWKDEFDRNEGSSLKHLCRLRVRKSLKCVGDLKMLDGIPKKLKDYVLCKSDF